MKKFFVIAFLLYSVAGGFAQIHTPFSTPKIWLRTDVPGTVNTQWADCSGHGYHATVNNNQVLPDSGLFNYNKCFVFDSSSQPLSIDYKAKPTAKLLVFAVYKPNAPQAEEGIWNLVLDSSIQVKLTTQKLKNVFRVIKYADSTLTSPIINLLSQNWKNKHIDSTASFMHIAGTDSLNFTGKFAEFILYDSTVTGNEILKLHTYLGIKYGVSIRQMNYIGSDDSTIWNYRNNIDYNIDIAGIGRDTVIHINQKQSAGNGGESPLKIAAGRLKNTNDENPYSIAEGNFLIWGNNGKSIGEINEDTINPILVENVSKSIWFMKRTGDSASHISTQVVLSTAGIVDADTIRLIINRYADSFFPVESTIAYYADSIDSTGNYYFNNIKWDTDNSGSDVFSFQIKKEVVLKSMESDSTENNSEDQQSDNDSDNNGSNNASILYCSLYPNPTISNYTINIKIDNPSPISGIIQDVNGKNIDAFHRSGSTEYTISGYINEPGIYFVTIETVSDKKTFRLVIN